MIPLIRRLRLLAVSGYWWRPFVMGRSTSIAGIGKGVLYLRINDDILSDNKGWVEVE